MTTLYVHSRKTAKSSVPVHQKAKLQTFKTSCLNLIDDHGLPSIHLLCHPWVLACRQAHDTWQNVLFRNFYLLPSVFPGMGKRPPSGDLSCEDPLGWLVDHPQQGFLRAKVETHYHCWELWRTSGTSLMSVSIDFLSCKSIKQEKHGL